MKMIFILLLSAISAGFRQHTCKTCESTLHFTIFPSLRMVPPASCKQVLRGWQTPETPSGNLQTSPTDFGDCRTFGELGCEWSGE